MLTMEANVFLLSTLAIFRVIGKIKIAEMESGLSMTCDVQQCGILTSVDSDEPLQPPF